MSGARVVGLPQVVPASRWTSEDWARYEKHAALESIAARLKAERGIAAAAAARVNRLEILFATRCRQVADGEWPPKHEDVQP